MREYGNYIQGCVKRKVDIGIGVAMKILNSIKNKCGGMPVAYVFISFILGFLGMGGGILFTS